MRVISGIYGGRTLHSPADLKTRPTSDRLRETLFSILGPNIDESTRFLDLCAGTGAVGIEALSRGAGFASFVDKSRRACALVERNLDSLDIPEERTAVFCNAAGKFLTRESGQTWDIIFYDPPYTGGYSSVLARIGDEACAALRSSGILIVEHHSKRRIDESAGELRRWRIVKQGETYLSFFEKK